MKPFNLKEYLKDPSKEVITRDGRSAKIHCTNYCSSNFPIVAEIEGRNFSEIFTRDGYYNGDKRESSNDLFFASKKHEGWINVYEEGTNRYLDGCICSTEEEAKRIRGCGYITTIKIEWEE